MLFMSIAFFGKGVAALGWAVMSDVAPREATGRLFLEAGRKYPLVVEYSHNASADAALVELNWSSPSRPRTAIPTDCLRTPDGRRNGVAGVYFANAKPSGPGLMQVEPQINFNWGRELPPLLRKPRDIAALAERAFTVRLMFAEPEEIRAGQRVFDVKLQGREVLPALDIVKQAGGGRRGIVREFRGVKATGALEIEFVPHSAKPPLICGVELIAEQP